MAGKTNGMAGVRPGMAGQTNGVAGVSPGVGGGRPGKACDPPGVAGERQGLPDDPQGAPGDARYAAARCWYRYFWKPLNALPISSGAGPRRKDSPHRRGYSSHTMTEPAQALERVTDAGKFEELVMAVLRRAKPEYRGLIHTGRNSEGKTV